MVSLIDFSYFVLANITFKFAKDSKKNLVMTPYRSSRPELIGKKGVLRNFSKFTEKHLSQSLFLNKAAGFRPANLLKKRFWHRCFPVNFEKFLRITFFIEYFWWLILPLANVAITSLPPVKSRRES